MNTTHPPVTRWLLFGLLFALAGASSARSQPLPAEASTTEASGSPPQELFVTVDARPTR